MRRRIKTTLGTEIVLDGDLLNVMETLYRDVTVRLGFNHSPDDLAAEITSLLAQMSDEEKHEYLQESLFLNTVAYERQRAKAYVRAMTRKGRPSSQSSSGVRKH